MDDYKSPAYGSQGESHIGILPEQKEIENYKLFADADYTVLDYPNQMRESIQKVASFLANRFRGKTILVMGIGTSGAMMMALLQHYLMNSHEKDAVTLKFYIIRKPGDNGHGMWFNDMFREFPTVLIDDHVAGGSTMLNLPSLIQEKFGGKVLYNIVGIAAENAHRLARFHRIREYYPNLEFVLH